MTPFLVVGANGQLGRAFCRRLQGSALGLAKCDLDITDLSRVRDRLTDARPEVVLNCAAYNQVDRAETEGGAAFGVNALGARNLAEVCRDLGALLVHFSTNYVFGLDGERRRPYVEEDSTGPINVYGATKLAGEYFVRAIAPRHLVIRTSALFGVGGRNFVETILEQARRGAILRVVSDQICSLTYAEDLVTATVSLIDQASNGLFHVTNAQSCTWHQFAARILDLSGVKGVLQPVTSAEYGATARRPSYSVLENQPEKRAQLPQAQPWQDALKRYLTRSPDRP